MKAGVTYEKPLFREPRHSLSCDSYYAGREGLFNYE